MTNRDENYTNVLLEEIRSQMQLVVGLSLDTRDKVTALPTMQGDITGLKDDVAVIKRAVTDTNEELKLLERHVARLENS